MVTTTIAAPPASVIMSTPVVTVMPAEAASVDLDRRDPDVPILAAIIGEL